MRALKLSYSDVGEGGVAVNCKKKQIFLYYNSIIRYSAVNHAVLLTGYGTNYWIIKNSWSRGWGEAGYIK